MASVMGICGGLVGPESENVDKVLGLKAFLKGSSEIQRSGAWRFEGVVGA